MTFFVLNRAIAGTALAMVGWLALVGPASAASAKSPATQDLPPVLQEAVKAGQLKVNKQFKTDVPGMTGYILEQNGQHQIVYGDHGYLFVGKLISPDGKNMSAEYSDKYVPKPNVSKVVDQLKSSGHLVQQGPDDAPVLYVFADPNCIYCHRFYQRVQPLVEAGKLQLQWAMVGFLKKSSMGRAAAILSADDPAKALVENENGFDEDTENGGIEPVENVPDELKNVIDTYYRRMAAAGGNGTPTVLYKNDDQWAAKIGLPSKDWLNQYAQQHG
ncbi:thiol:disulfide interchange protein DsbG [Salinisphaera sp.]|uniref:thiol:disulfide interchange protein DsbG n=1 Tax=Salinisphaera sp. TaxID=1914330 RepID=UPI002D78F9CD|nr:thiol:disulfide interchange protein DsbG [Salinisphaera sp.]HET7315238.1 thiol:disulfide interchange protein DsbG [Salinisphaera sp.]